MTSSCEVRHSVRWRNGETPHRYRRTVHFSNSSKLELRLVKFDRHRRQSTARKLRRPRRCPRRIPRGVKDGQPLRCAGINRAATPGPRSAIAETAYAITKSDLRGSEVPFHLREGGRTDPNANPTRRPAAARGGARSSR